MYELLDLLLNHPMKNVIRQMHNKINYHVVLFLVINKSFFPLIRSCENKRMAEFFRNDFTEERWRKAALKNAFDLLGKQRFQHSAGFFLLAGSLNDAIEVKCLH